MIYLRRKEKVVIPKGKYSRKSMHTYVVTMLKNIEDLGYTFSPELIEMLNTHKETDLVDIYGKMVKTLREMVGEHKRFRPMYPNFPVQVMEADEAELYLNALMHYIGRALGYTILPKYRKKKRATLSDNIKLKVIELGSIEDFNKIFTNLVASKTSVSDQDKEDIEWFVNKCENVMDILPESIPHKENLCYVSSLLMNKKYDMSKISDNFKTSTDVLRLITAVSHGDVSLTENCKFKKMSRFERRSFLFLLEDRCWNIDDMVKHRKKWIRVGEILHPFEYKKRYPKCFKAFDTIRNDPKYRTKNAIIEETLSNGKFVKAADLLKINPGELARKMDFLLRSTSTPLSIVQKFKEVSDAVSTPVLMQVLAHFKGRNTISDIRAVFPKGNTAKAFVLPNDLKGIKEDICLKMVSICEKALIKKFKELNTLGKVFIDKNLSNYIVPFSQRSASKALKTIVRGSRIEMGDPEKDTIRFFLWWKNGDEVTDIDLSASMYNCDWEYRNNISYTNLKSENSCHSGDITDAPNGACEFIDLDITAMAKSGLRYIIMSTHSYTKQPYCDLPECFAGWMMRGEVQSGEIFDPTTVKQKIDLSSNSVSCAPVVMDILERKVIWADLSLKQGETFNNIESNKNKAVLAAKAVLNTKKMNLYDLFTIQAKARGKIVKKKEDADIVFSVEEGVTPYDIDDIMANYM